VEASTKQCTPRLANFEASAEEDFVHLSKAMSTFLTVFGAMVYFIIHIFIVIWLFILVVAY